MTSYLGPLGGMVAFECPSSLSVGTSRATVERVTTSGVVNVQVSPRTRREWRVDWSVVTPAEVSSLAALVAGEFGYGPFWFVDPWAQVTNLLAPEASVLDWPTPPGLAVGGPATLADGSRLGRTMAVADPATIVTTHRYGTAPHLVPVLPGRPVTGSVYASGTGTVGVRFTWYDAQGAQVTVTPYSNFTPGGVMSRLHVTATPPVGAAACTVGLTGANRFARPAVTWTDELLDWHVGQGAPSVAIPAGLSQNIILATREPRAHGRMAAVGTTIREIG